MRKMIPENLVNVYDLTIPYAFDMRKLRKQLDAELEKLHPCFPDRCAVDYRFRFLTYGKRAGGFAVRALVIDRLKLADLRKKNAGCLLYSGGMHPYPVFSGDILKKRVAFAAVIVAGISAVVLAISLFSGGNRVLSVEEPVLVSEQSVAETAAEICFSDETAQPHDFSPCISSIYGQGGKLSFCSWKADAALLSLRTEGLFPEQLAETAGDECGISFGAVSYRDGVPELEMTLFCLTPVKQTDAFLIPDADVTAVRELFFGSGGALVSETVNPPSLNGTVPEKAWAAFASALQKTLSDAAISGLELSRESGQISVLLQFAAPVPDALSVHSGCAELPLSDMAGVFADAPGLPFERVSADVTLVEDKTLEDERQKALMKQREIGRIQRDDGSSVVFFHNDDGKIERRIYEN